MQYLLVKEKTIRDRLISRKKTKSFNQSQTGSILWMCFESESQCRPDVKLIYKIPGKMVG